VSRSPRRRPCATKTEVVPRGFGCRQRPPLHRLRGDDRAGRGRPPEPFPPDAAASLGTAYVRARTSASILRARARGRIRTRRRARRPRTRAPRGTKGARSVSPVSSRPHEHMICSSGDAGTPRPLRRSDHGLERSGPAQSSGGTWAHRPTGPRQPPLSQLSTRRRLGRRQMRREPTVEGFGSCGRLARLPWGDRLVDDVGHSLRRWCMRTWLAAARPTARRVGAPRERRGCRRAREQQSACACAGCR
jgi:hypothetical protein